MRWFYLMLLAVPTLAQAESAVLRVGGIGQAPHTISQPQLDALKPATQHQDADPGHSTPARDWAGVALWDVLIASGVVDPTKPGDQVRRIVRLTGSDGYVAVLALAEISPEFAGKPVLLADRLDGAAIPREGWRLIVPGENRLGRSVRDVVRIDVEQP